MRGLESREEAMSSQPASAGGAEETTSTNRTAGTAHTVREPEANEMPCPVCGSAMPDLKGGKASICPTCGFKDSCCF